MARRRFVVLDRDGTIIVERHYLSDPEKVELLPGAADGMRRLRDLGLGLVVVTNQSAIGRGYFGPERLAEIHERLVGDLRREEIQLDGIFFCPHTPDDGCACRKPRTGMVERAALELGFDAREGFVVGDLPSDILLGQALGSTTLLIRTGHGARTEAEGEARPDYVVDGLVDAAEVIRGLLEAS
jgi:histidinol-phosphate phosphatase family protein